jgi:hypothetical protein
MITRRAACPKCGNNTMHVALTDTEVLYECMFCGYGRVEPWVWQPISPSGQVCSHTSGFEMTVAGLMSVADCDETAVFMRTAEYVGPEYACVRHAADTVEDVPSECSSEQALAFIRARASAEGTEATAASERAAREAAALREFPMSPERA